IPALGMVIGRPPNAPPDATAVWSFVTAMALFYAFIFALALLMSVLFFFIYPLIVDRGLTGVEAVKTSARAALGNLAGVVGLVLLNGMLGLVGAMCCYVGAFFVMPITFGAILVAYRQVFPE